MKPPIVVARAIFPEHLSLLRERFDVLDNQDDTVFDVATQHARMVGKLGVLVTGTEAIDEAALAAAPSLRVVSTITVGYNHIDVAACTRRGVMVTNTPDVLTETTADMGWALMMAAARRIPESEKWMRAGHWQRWALDQFLGSDLHHSTLGILGMGRIGQAIARRAAGFSMRVVYHNRSRLDADIEAECKASWVDFDALLAQSDHLMVVVPYSAANHHMIGAQQLARMKRGATLTNIARGGLIDEDALVDALQSGHIFAAGLDVFEGEPRVNPRLLTVANVALAPHLGSASWGTRDAMARLAIKNLTAAIDGQRPPSLLNPESWPPQ